MKKYLFVLLVFAIMLTFISCSSCKHDDPTKIVVCEAKAPTCQEAGLTQGMKCTLCDTMVVPQTLVPKIDCIESDWIVDKEATKTEDGKKHTECTMCHRNMQDGVISAGSQGLQYTLSDDCESYSVTGIGSCTDKDIVIPITYNGLLVNSIGFMAFYNCSSLASVVIPDGVMSVGNWAFRGCTSLGSVLIGDSVTSIGHEAFSNCTSLTLVVIPDSVTSISVDVFEGCDKLQFSEYENGKYLGTEDNPYFALLEVTNKNLSSYTIHEDAKIISESLFSDCDSLISVVIPDGVTYIGETAFFNCNSLTSVVIGDSVTSIGRSVFANCPSLTTVVIPDSVTSIGQLSFGLCSSLTTIKFEGTFEQWNAISLGTWWNAYVPATEVICSNGTVPLS